MTVLMPESKPLIRKQVIDRLEDVAYKIGGYRSTVKALSLSGQYDTPPRLAGVFFHLRNSIRRLDTELYELVEGLRDLEESQQDGSQEATQW